MHGPPSPDLQINRPAPDAVQNALVFPPPTSGKFWDWNKAACRTCPCHCPLHKTNHVKSSTPPSPLSQIKQTDGQTNGWIIRKTDNGEWCLKESRTHATVDLFKSNYCCLFYLQKDIVCVRRQEQEEDTAGCLILARAHADHSSLLCLMTPSSRPPETAAASMEIGVCVLLSFISLLCTFEVQVSVL